MANFLLLTFFENAVLTMNISVLDRRPKFYGRSRRFYTYGYGYGGRSLRTFLRPKKTIVFFCGFLANFQGGPQNQVCVKIKD